MKHGSKQADHHTLTMSRRCFLRLGTGLAIAAAALPAYASLSLPYTPERKLSLYNIRTGEFLQTVYWAEGHYLGEAMSEIDFLLRDHRNGEIKPIAADLLDLLHALNLALGNQQALHIVSGYRSPETNAMLAAKHARVAKHSLHIEGKAVDLFVPGLPLKQLHRAALGLAGGGVGYYGRSQFVHLDVGPLRRWGA